MDFYTLIDLEKIAEFISENKLNDRKLSVLIEIDDKDEWEQTLKMHYDVFEDTNIFNNVTEVNVNISGTKFCYKYVG